MDKKTFYILILLLFSIAFCDSSALAQDSTFKWAVKPSYSLLQYKGELGSQFMHFNQRNDGAGIALSRYINPSIDAIMGFDYYRLKLKGTINDSLCNSSGNIFSPVFSLNYKFYNGYLLPIDPKIKPYAGFGFGYLIGKTSGKNHISNFEHFIDEISLNVSVGFKYDLNKRISAFVELQGVFASTEELDGLAGVVLDGVFYTTEQLKDPSEAIYDPSVNTMRNDKYGGGRIGLFIKLGSEPDQDKDGVPDVKDDCPDTPRGVDVDEHGCPLDRDNDGIPDYLDDCPDDPGLAIYNGCPDTDGDGIIDKIDDCPELPGIPKYNGCPDTDGDGVIDPNDLCPDTQPGVVVDEYGCPIDSDGDGLSDDVDQCPDEFGPIEYLGCPEPPDVGWPAVENDTPPEVYFKTDEYEIEPDQEEELQKLVKYMFENPNINIRLYGFADPRGSQEYNSVLSARRVDAVKKHLMRKGIPESRIAVRALGEIQEVKSAKGEENMTVDQKYRKARKVMFETFFFMK